MTSEDGERKHDVLSRVGYLPKPGNRSIRITMETQQQLDNINTQTI